jgi:Domain of unknown function (DUF5615)
VRFLIDECLHESLVGVAHRAGFEATHVNRLGLSGKPDWELAERTWVTNNRVDFIGLFGKMELHAGLINAVIEVTSNRKRATRRARKVGAQGEVTLSLVIESDGSVQDATTDPVARLFDLRVEAWRKKVAMCDVSSSGISHRSFPE